MTVQQKVQFILSNGQPQWVVVPYNEYIKLKESEEVASNLLGARPQSLLPQPYQERQKRGESLIRLWREYRGLTQAQLAQAAEISIPYLCQLERQLRSGSKRVLRRLAGALGVDIDAII